MKRAAVSGVLLISAAAGLGLVASLGACSVVATFDDRPSSDGGSGSKDAGTNEKDGPSNNNDDSGEQGVYANGCRGRAGPEPVKALGFCIDSTEVTNAQYAEFVGATNGGKPGAQVATCASNSTYVPQSDWPADAAKATFPVVQVDWCDAHAFCAWAGKRLCGKLGGGATPPQDAPTIVDQWFLACSAGGTRPYPYAGAYADHSCNGGDHDLDRALAVGTMPKCEGGIPGLFDMSGNVAEWQDSCSGSAGAADQCLVRGGGFESSESKMGCAVLVLDTRNNAHGDVGFRCCSSP